MEQYFCSSVIETLGKKNVKKKKENIKEAVFFF